MDPVCGNLVQYEVYPSDLLTVGMKHAQTQGMKLGHSWALEQAIYTKTRCLQLLIFQ